MIRSEITAKAVVRNPIAVIAAALLPGAVVRLPVPCPMILPGSLLDMLLCPALLWNGSTSLLPGVLLLLADGLALRLPSLWSSTLGVVRPPLLRLSRLPALLRSRLLLPGRRLWLLAALRIRLGLLVFIVLLWAVLVRWTVLRCTGEDSNTEEQRQNGPMCDSRFLHKGTFQC